MNKDAIALAFAQSSLDREYAKDTNIAPGTALFELLKAYDFALNNLDATYQQVKDSQA